MLEVSEELKKAFMTDNVEKQIRITFPNGEHEDITNEKIVANSMTYTESLVSGDELKFGLCESNVFKITAKCGDIKNAVIKVYITALYEGEEHTVPCGTFTVKSCKKYAGVSLRDIEAYSNNIFDVNNLTTRYENWKKTIPIEGTTAPKRYSNDIQTILAPLGQYGNNENWIDVSPTVFPKPYPSGDFRNDRCINIGYYGYIIANTKQATIIYEPYFYDMYNDPTYIQRFDYTYDEEKRKQAQKALYKLFGEYQLYFEPDFNDGYIGAGMDYNEVFSLLFSLEPIMLARFYYTPDGYTEHVVYESYVPMSKNEPFYFFNSSNNKQQCVYEQILYFPKIVKYRDRTDRTGFMNVIDLGLNAHVQAKKIFNNDIYPPKGLFTYSILKDIVTTKTVQGRSYTLNLYNKDEDKTNLEELINSYAEFNGLFGYADKYGGYALMAINNNFALYPNDLIYPNGETFPIIGSKNYQPLTTVSFKDADYEEYVTQPYGYVRVTYLATDEEKYSITVLCDVSKPNVYEMLDNYVFLNRIWTAQEVKEAINTYFYPNIKDISYNPANINIKGLPFLTLGDVIKVIADDGSFKTFVFRRTLSGEQLLVDNIEAKGDEINEKAELYKSVVGQAEKERR